MDSVGVSTDVGRTRSSLNSLPTSTDFRRYPTPDRHEHTTPAVHDRRRTDIESNRDPNTTGSLERRYRGSANGHRPRSPDVLAAEYGATREPDRRVERGFCEREHGTRPVRPRLDVVFAAESKPSLERRR